jgi:hypothetical protein
MTYARTGDTMGARELRQTVDDMEERDQRDLLVARVRYRLDYQRTANCQCRRGPPIAQRVVSQLLLSMFSVF